MVWGIGKKLSDYAAVTTDTRKRELFSKLPNHLQVLASEIEKAIAQHDRIRTQGPG